MYHHIYTHTNNHIHDRTQQYTNIIYTDTHTDTHTSNVDILLTIYFNFFDFAKIFLSLSEDCRIKTVWNQWLQISIHAVKYTYKLIYIFIYYYIMTLSQIFSYLQIILHWSATNSSSEIVTTSVNYVRKYVEITDEQYEIVPACRKTIRKNYRSTWVKTGSENVDVPMGVVMILHK